MRCQPQHQDFLSAALEAPGCSAAPSKSPPCTVGGQCKGCSTQPKRVSFSGSLESWEHVACDLQPLFLPPTPATRWSSLTRIIPWRFGSGAPKSGLAKGSQEPSRHRHSAIRHANRQPSGQRIAPEGTRQRITFKTRTEKGLAGRVFCAP